MSEDASIERFVPHRARTSTREDLLVWATDTRHLPLYWFPRDCPRGTWWADETTTAEDTNLLLASASRVHAIDAAWFERMRTARVYAYRLPEATFAPDEEVGGYWLSRDPVEPLELVEVADLPARHAEAAIELRIVPDLARLWERVIASTVQFSGIRLRNLRAGD